MDGVCIYESKTKEYIYSCDFEMNAKITINNYLKESNYDVFTYVIHDNRLACHYMHLDSHPAVDYYLYERKVNVYPFINSPVLDHNDIAMFEVVLRNNEYDTLYNELSKFIEEKRIIVKTSSLNDEYLLVTIKPYKGKRKEALKHLSCYNQCNYKVMFISTKDDLALAKIADFKICLASADEEVRDACDCVVESDDFNDVLRIFDKVYYHKDYIKYLKSL